MAQDTLPTDVAVDGAQNVYVLDDFGSRITRISPSGAALVWAGGGSQTADGAPASDSKATDFGRWLRRIGHRDTARKPGPSGPGGMAAAPRA